MTRITPLLLAAAALAAAGCGSNKDNSNGSANGSPSSSSGTKQSSGGGSGPSIEMKNISFSPKQQTVKVGQKVTWVNQDSVQHNVVATAGAKFQSDTFGQGGTYSFTPTKPGTIKYTCTLHPGMDAQLTVTG